MRSRLRFALGTGALALSLTGCAASAVLDPREPGSDAGVSVVTGPSEDTLIYVIVQGSLEAPASHLGQFIPGTPPRFQDLGAINCVGESDEIPVLSVAPDGVAWMLDPNGLLFNLYPADGGCTTAGDLHLEAGFLGTSLAFVPADGGLGSEGLFVTGLVGQSSGAWILGEISLVDPAVQVVTNLPAGSSLTLTGTGTGELLTLQGPGGTTPASISQVNTQTAAETRLLTISGVGLPALGGPSSDWAFAFDHGDYWVFQPAPIATNIWRIDGTTGVGTLELASVLSLLAVGQSAGPLVTGN